MKVLSLSKMKLICYLPILMFAGIAEHEYAMKKMDIIQKLFNVDTTVGLIILMDI